MAKITFIGAGSLVFTNNLCNDILLAPALQDSTIMLMDIDPERLEQSKQIVGAIVDKRKLPARIEASTDRTQAIRNADYVVTTFQQGGLEAYESDIEIPRKYGVEQCVGDTLGPGGIFRALRTIPVLLELCAEMDKLAPDALLLNYVNPMAANCWAVDAGTGRPHVGLCHSVQGTSEMLAKWVGVPYEEVRFFCAGINHQAFFLEFLHFDKDLYPLIREAVERPEIYGEEPVRIDLMKHFGYFVTESSGHASEYGPYFRKSAKMVEEELVPKFTHQANYWLEFGRTGGYLHHCQRRLEEFPIRINGNVPNTGLIEKLHEGCCVEVPCLVDANGIQPTKVRKLPPQLAALNRTNINVQELIVEAALTGSREAIYHAAMLDPLAAAVCTLPQIRSMVDELLRAQQRWLPKTK